MQILTALLDGPVRILELSRKAGVAYSSTIQITKRFQRIGVLRIVRVRYRKTYVMLDAAFPGSAYLKRYLRAIRAQAPEPSRLSRSAVWHIWHKRVPRRPEKRTPAELFGSALRTRVLALIAVNGELTAKDIAESLGRNPMRMGPTLDVLVAIGLLERRSHRIRRTYRLSTAGAGADELRRLLRRMARVIPELDLGAVAIRSDADVRGNKNRPEMITDDGVPQRLSFLKPAQARVLARVATEPRTLREILERIDVHPESVRATVCHLLRTGVLASTPFAGARKISLNPEYSAFTEVRDVLCAAIGESPPQTIARVGPGTPTAIGYRRRLRILAALAVLGEGTEAQIMALASPRRRDSSVRSYLTLITRRMLIVRTAAGFRFAPTPLASATSRLMLRYSEVILNAADPAVRLQSEQ